MLGPGTYRSLAPAGMLLLLALAIGEGRRLSCNVLENVSSDR